MIPITITNRVVAVLDNNLSIDDGRPVGPEDRVSTRLPAISHLEFVDDLNDEFGLVLDADTILELDTVAAIADHVSNELARIHAH